MDFFHEFNEALGDFLDRHKVIAFVNDCLGALFIGYFGADIITHAWSLLIALL